MSGERASVIADAVAASDRRAYVPVRDGFEAFPVASLPLSLPLFRAANGRLAVRLADHCRKHGVSPDYFSDNEEADDVQDVLVALLIDLARDRSGPIYDELQRTAVQTEPLLLTADGVVVNGNRRLAAMRDLHAADPVRFGSFEMVDATVLPEKTPDADIEMIEAALQMAPETKLAYGWLDRRIKLRRQRDVAKLSAAEICAGYRLKDPAKIDVEIGELELAESYLSDRLNMPFAYGEIAEDAALFVGLANQLAKLDEPGRTTWRAIGFAMIEAAGDLDHDLRTVFPFAEAKPLYAPGAVLWRFGREEGLWTPGPEIETEAPLPPEKHKSLVDAVTQHIEAKRTTEAVISLFQQVAEEHRDLASPRIILRQVRQLNRRFERADFNRFSARERRELTGQLAELDYFISSFRGGKPAKRSRRRPFWRRLHSFFK